jgi:hypothetical protein
MGPNHLSKWTTVESAAPFRSGSAGSRLTPRQGHPHGPIAMTFLLDTASLLDEPRATV